MPTFEVTLPCRECEGYGQLIRRASETLDIARPCPFCYGEGQQMFYETVYETVDEVRDEYPDAEFIMEIPHEDANHGN